MHFPRNFHADAFIRSGEVGLRARWCAAEGQADGPDHENFN